MYTIIGDVYLRVVFSLSYFLMLIVLVRIVLRLSEEVRTSYKLALEAPYLILKHCLTTGHVFFISS